MKFRLSERGIVLAEFAIALPLLILLLGSLGLVTLKALKIAREQAADYALETEAQYVMDRITADARAAHSTEIKSANGFDEIIFFCSGIGEYEHDDLKIAGVEKSMYYYRNVFDPRIYRIDNREGGVFCVYFKHSDDDTHTSPLTGENSYGRTYITKFKFTRNEKILHVTLGMKSLATDKKIELSTAVFMPDCE